ncbi:hypothetical protein KEM60_02553 [Austwickia sp. TVS 96-490-7B]|uniref:ATP-grasp domain-containing protein n=1 Tax=Austwickia sp. TVS 96-490-7B TaxID=2830843 RepID=UPI001C58813F|nr:ATP-grasp domain-containing protein [Austwickia sp. TVS 96-490-7B]MBW3086340.1 hypothetical protein [Austwickia sp. TVS 96-490-7B]
MVEGSVFVLMGRDHAGGIRLLADRLRPLGIPLVLLSNLEQDLDAPNADEHVVIDWDTESPEVLFERLAKLKLQPIGVFNLLESLSRWHVELTQYYGLPGPGWGHTRLADKSQVREALAALGLSSLWFEALPASELSQASPPRFPVIAKPASRSGASEEVEVLHGRTDLLRYRDRVTVTLGPSKTILLEGFIAGTEFSVDGPLTEDGFRPLFVAEKSGRREEVHDVSVSWPPSSMVQQAGIKVAEVVSILTKHVGADSGWLHVEARCEAEDTELIEINVRPGGHVYMSAIRLATGIDPLASLVSCWIPSSLRTPSQEESRADGLALRMETIEAEEVGTVIIDSSQEDVLALPGVRDALLISPYHAVSQHKENFFAILLVTASSHREAAMLAEAARAKVRFHVDDEA